MMVQRVWYIVCASGDWRPGGASGDRKTKVKKTNHHIVLLLNLEELRGWRWARGLLVHHLRSFEVNGGDLARRSVRDLTGKGGGSCGPCLFEFFCDRSEY